MIAQCEKYSAAHKSKFVAHTVNGNLSSSKVLALIYLSTTSCTFFKLNSDTRLRLKVNKSLTEFSIKIPRISSGLNPAATKSHMSDHILLHDTLAIWMFCSCKACNTQICIKPFAHHPDNTR